MNPGPRLAAAAALLMLAGSGCAGAKATAAAAASSVTVTMRYSRFTPDRVTVPRGTPVRFVLRNDDPIDHEFIVGDAAVHERHASGTEPEHGDRETERSVPAQSVVETTITFDESGSFLFVCHLPGHQAHGMQGRIDVRG